MRVYGSNRPDSYHTRQIIGFTLEDANTAFRIGDERSHLIAAPLSMFTRARGLALSGLAAARPGDLVWIREPFTLFTPHDPAMRGILVAASDDPLMRGPHDPQHRYRASARQPSEMARFQSRLTLQITAIRTGSAAVPLSLLSDTDATAAGFPDADAMLADIRTGPGFGRITGNPLMVVAEFITCHANIDAVVRELQPETQGA